MRNNIALSFCYWNSHKNGLIMSINRSDNVSKNDQAFHSSWSRLWLLQIKIKFEQNKESNYLPDSSAQMSLKNDVVESHRTLIKDFDAAGVIIPWSMLFRTDPDLSLLSLILRGFFNSNSFDVNWNMLTINLFHITISDTQSQINTGDTCALAGSLSRLN